MRGGTAVTLSGRNATAADVHMPRRHSVMKKAAKAKSKATVKVKDLKARKNPKGGRKAGGKQEVF
jgi:hypothetical protein